MKHLKKRNPSIQAELEGKRGYVIYLELCKLDTDKN